MRDAFPICAPLFSPLDFAVALGDSALVINPCFSCLFRRWPPYLEFPVFRMAFPSSLAAALIFVHALLALAFPGGFET